MKKTKFAFWLLGFGCGITLTGIIGAFITLGAQSPNIHENTQKDEVSVITEEPVKESPVVALDETKNTENDQVQLPMQEIASSPSSEKEEVSPSLLVEPEKEEEEISYKEIKIPKTANAREICEILQKEGLINDAEDFLNYIRKHKKQRFLQHGYISLPIGASYEQLLEELTV